MSLKLNSQTKVGREAGFTIIELMIATAVFSGVLIIMIYGVLNFYNVYNKSTISASIQNAAINISDAVAQNIKLSQYQQWYPTSPTPPQDWAYGACFGNTEFVYRLDITLGETEQAPFTVPSTPPYNQYGPPFVLYEMPAPSPCAYTNPDQNPGYPTSYPWTNSNWSLGTSLIGDHYRLLDFSVSCVSFPGFPNDTCTSGGAGNGGATSNTNWLIDIKLAYTSGGSTGGGDDLLCSPSLGNTKGGCTPTAQALGNLSYNNATINTDIQCRPSAGSQFCYVDEIKSIVGTRF